MIPTTLIALYEMKSIVKLGREVAEKEKKSPEEKREDAMRKAIEAEKKRLEEIGYKPDEKEDALESGEDNEEEND